MAQQMKSDWLLFGTTVAMVGFGLVMIYSASSVTAELNPRINSSFYYAWHQLIWAAVSFVALMFFKRRDYHMLQSPTWAFGSLGMVLFLQILVFFLDSKTHRWFRLQGVGTLQPSEFAKPALIIFFAYFVTQKREAINSRRTIVAASLALAVLAATVGLGDLGTAVVLIVPAAVVFYVAGLERKFVVAALLAGALIAVGFIASKPYRMARIVGFFDPDYKMIGMLDHEGRIKKYVSQSVTTRDAGYQVRQSKIAVGSGGLLGLGLMQGKQKILYLPEAHTDFIYAVVGEELGLWGCSAILAGFLVILGRGLQLYWVAHDDFGRYLALGVTSSIVIQALINMSVVLGMGPTKGIPLPMISAGGSSLMSTLICLGMLLSVSEHSGY
jgi:cell division protein FtsW